MPSLTPEKLRKLETSVGKPIGDRDPDEVSDIGDKFSESADGIYSRKLIINTGKYEEYLNKEAVQLYREAANQGDPGCTV